MGTSFSCQNLENEQSPYIYGMCDPDIFNNAFWGDSLVVSAFLLPMPIFRALYTVKSAAGVKLLWRNPRQEVSK